MSTPLIMPAANANRNPISMASGIETPATGEMERPSGRHRVDRDDRQIDAATDHENRHPDTENAQNGDAAHEREKIARTKKSV